MSPNFLSFIWVQDFLLLQLLSFKLIQLSACTICESKMNIYSFADKFARVKKNYLAETIFLKLSSLYQTNKNSLNTIQTNKPVALIKIMFLKKFKVESFLIGFCSAVGKPFFVGG